MKRILLMLAALGLALVVGGFFVVASGIMPIGAASGHWKVTEAFLGFAMRRSVATHSLLIKTPALGRTHILAGAAYYEIGCRACHGAPGMPQSPIVRRMVPRPPDLSERAAERKPRELFYVVKNGVKFTGMPAWPSPRRDDEIWAVVAFLMELPGLDAAGYRRLAHGEGLPLPRELPTALARCVVCHGLDGQGRGNSLFPKLAGQHAEYQRNALEAYARGERHSGIMEPIAAGLGNAEIRLLSDYFSRLRPPAAASPRESEAIARGRSIAEHGIRGRRVPSCIACHAPEGEPFRAPGAKPINPAYPLLAGQPADYLERQLGLFKDEKRGGSAYAHIMSPIAARLTPGEMRDVALYFEALRLP